MLMPFLVIGISIHPACIIMQYCDWSLHDWLHVDSVALDPAMIHRFMCEIAEGMRYLHSLRIIHRDLKSPKSASFLIS